MEKEQNNYFVAIDMGTSKVITLVGQKAEGGKVSIISSSCSEANGISRGDIKNIDQIVESVQSSLAKIETESGIKVCEAYVGLSGQHIKCQQHDGYVFVTNKENVVREEDVYALSDSMRNVQVKAGEAIIHILPQNYILDDDSDINEPVGMIGNKLAGVFNIVTGQKSNISLVERCLGRTDVNISEVILSSLASAEAVLVDDEKELGVVVVDMGGGTCDICIYHDKTIRYLGVIPIGGTIINRDIKSCGVLERYVEKLKIKFGSAYSDDIPENQVITIPNVNNTPSREMPQKMLASIIEARMLDVIERVADIIEQTGFKGALNGGVVLTGGCAMLKDLDKLFRKHLNCDVRIAVPDLYVTPDTVDKVNSPIYSTAVGLLLKAIVLGKPSKTIMIRRTRPTMPGGYENDYGYVRPEGGTFVTPMSRGGAQFTSDVEEDDYDNIPGEPDTMPENRYDIDDRNRSPKGLGGWLRGTVDKMRGVFEPDDDLEDNTL